MALPKSFDEGLTLADKLAEFANLQPEGVAEFRTKNPHFVPSTVWEAMHADLTTEGFELVWQQMQKIVRTAWESGFSPDDCVELIVRGAQFATMQQNFKDQEELIELGVKLGLGEAEYYEHVRKQMLRKREIFGYQQAVMFLNVQPWRAAKCPGAMGQPCGKYFVKQAKRSIYCSEECFNANRSADKRRWWTDVGTKQRAQKLKAKTKRPKK